MRVRDYLFTPFVNPVPLGKGVRDWLRDWLVGGPNVQTHHLQLVNIVTGQHNGPRPANTSAKALIVLYLYIVDLVVYPILYYTPIH